CTVMSISTRPVYPASSARLVPLRSAVRYEVLTRTGRSSATSSGEYVEVSVVASEAFSRTATVVDLISVIAPFGDICTPTDCRIRCGGRSGPWSCGVQPTRTSDTARATTVQCRRGPPRRWTADLPGRIRSGLVKIISSLGESAEWAQAGRTRGVTVRERSAPSSQAGGGAAVTRRTAHRRKPLERVRRVHYCESPAGDVGPSECQGFSE